jgi:hypothetical protein
MAYCQQSIPRITPAAPQRIPSGYDSIWALFTDWCTVNGLDPLPAEPGTVIAFLDCPCAPATQRRRVAAIDHRHAAAGLVKPGESTAVRTLLGRPTANTFEASPDIVTAVDAALRALPSQGWTRGMFGRRDRCLLVLSQLAGVPYRHLATLTAGHIFFTDGVASITSPAGRWSLRPEEHTLLCGPCAITRWLRVLDLAVTKISTSAMKAAVGQANLLTAESPHLCRSNKKLNAATTTAPLFPPINQWGALPFPLEPLTPHPCPNGSGTSSPATWGRTATSPSTRTTTSSRSSRHLFR